MFHPLLAILRHPPARRQARREVTARPAKKIKKKGTLDSGCPGSPDRIPAMKVERISANPIGVAPVTPALPANSPAKGMGRLRPTPKLTPKPLTANNLAI